VFYTIAKRVFDVAGAFVGLVLLFPVGVLIALLIKVFAPGPVFYGQVRVGQFGRPFRIWKFRSMFVNADQMGALLTKGEDPRITRIGRILRKTKLDELPQLWNVLTGEMSFVGPRPEVQRYVEHYTQEQREMLNYKPGITDLASVIFRNEEELLRGTPNVEEFYLQYCLPRKLQLNRQHALRASVVSDFWVILQTLCPYWLGVLAIYALALTAGLWFSFLLRSDFVLTRAQFAEFMRCLPWMVGPQLVFLFWRGQLRGLMSYFSIPEMRRTGLALAAALFFQILLCLLFLRDEAPARAIYLINFMLSFFALCGVRMGFRLLREHALTSKTHDPKQLWRVAIIGTGEIATSIALDFSRRSRPARQVVAFFDDDPHTWHKRPHDIPVVGMPECLLKPEWRDTLDEVIVAIPEENPVRVESIKQMLKSIPAKVTFAPAWPVFNRAEG
jgi:lipopolysaccharide/colanic/teichoic acid biosynthesis glycosyltransferase